MSDEGGADQGLVTPAHVGQLNLPPWEEFRADFQDMFDRRYFANHGPLEQSLDQELARFFGAKHAIGMVNATAALMLVLRALDVTGEVILPSHTFIATAQAVVWAGATPVFCDVDAERQTLTRSLVAERVGPATQAILGVHVWGRGCDPDGLEELAQAHSLRLIFDAAHAFGCTHWGRRIGRFGNAEVFSLHATKVLNGLEGGVVVTDDEGLADGLRAMRSFHASEAAAGGRARLNAKMSEAQAAMALLGLRHFDHFVAENRERYEHYRGELEGTPGLTFLDYAAGEESNYQFIVVAIEPEAFGASRDELADHLRRRNVLARRYFHPGVHRTAPFSSAHELPVTDHLSRSLLQLPTGQAISLDDVRRICALVRSARGGELRA